MDLILDVATQCEAPDQFVLVGCSLSKGLSGSLKIDLGSIKLCIKKKGMTR